MVELVLQSRESLRKKNATIADYLAIARFHHSTKHILIIPGMAFAYLLRGIHTTSPLAHIVLGLITAVCIASGNYVINEWLDRDFDKYHPAKAQRSAVQRELRGRIVLAEWLAFLVIGLGCAYMASKLMFLVACIFALQGVVYNVPPMRTKDKPYLDVISESINNPLRLMIGWAMIDSTTLPPGSIILAYYLGGAFLMAAKRLSEYREIVASQGKAILVQYRASFEGYTETSLNVSCFLYAMLSNFVLAVFLLKYRIEYLLLMPVIAILFSHYLALSMQSGSSAQNPEKLFRERRLMIMVLTLAALFLVTTFVNFPSLQVLTEQRFIVIP